MSFPDVVAIVWSPRRVERALKSHEELGFETVFICGTTEHGGCALANVLVREYPARVYLLSYDDQVVTRAAADEVLQLQSDTGDVVSGWQHLANDTEFVSSVRPSWGSERMLEKRIECFYTAEEVKSGPRTLETLYFPFSLTAVPRRALLENPFRALSTIESGYGPMPSRDRKPYDKGMCSDWTLATDFAHNGWRMLTARDAQVEHIADHHNVQQHEFFTTVDRPGFYWGRRPR